MILIEKLNIHSIGPFSSKNLEQKTSFCHLGDKIWNREKEGKVFQIFQKLPQAIYSPRWFFKKVPEGNLSTQKINWKALAVLGLAAIGTITAIFQTMRTMPHFEVDSTSFADGAIAKGSFGFTEGIEIFPKVDQGFENALVSEDKTIDVLRIPLSERALSIKGTAKCFLATFLPLILLGIRGRCLLKTGNFNSTSSRRQETKREETGNDDEPIQAEDLTTSEKLFSTSTREKSPPIAQLDENRNEGLSAIKELVNSLKILNNPEDFLSALSKLNRKIVLFTRIPIEFEDSHNDLNHAELDELIQQYDKDINWIRNLDLFGELHADLKTEQLLKLKPNHELNGASSSFLIEGANGEILAIFKPVKNENQGAFRSKCFQKPGSQAVREFLSFFINKNSNFLAQIPITYLSRIKSHGVGSLQLWMQDAKEISSLGCEGDSRDSQIQRAFSSSEDFKQMLECWSKKDIRLTLKEQEHYLTTSELKTIVEQGFEKRSNALHKISIPEAQGLMAFHLLIASLDVLNSGNIIYIKEQDALSNSERIIPISIDNGFCLSDLSVAEVPAFTWRSWPQAEKPFCKKIAEKIQKIDMDRLEENIRQEIENVNRSEEIYEQSLTSVKDNQSLSLSFERKKEVKDSYSFEIPDETYYLLRGTAILLKEAVKARWTVASTADCLKAYFQELMIIKKVILKNKDLQKYEIFDKKCKEYIQKFIKQKAKNESSI